MNQQRLDRIVFTGLAVLFLAACVYAYGQIPERQSFWQSVGIFISAGLTLAIYSFLYRDNPLFKVAENLYVGVGAGYGIWIAIRHVLIPLLWEPLLQPAVYGCLDSVNLAFFWLGDLIAPTGVDPSYAFHPLAWFAQAKWTLLVPMVLGLMMWGRFHPKTEALSRISFGFIVGMGAGMSIPVTISAYLLEQTYATVSPSLFFDLQTGQAMPVINWINAVIILIGTLCVLVYFFFSVEHRGPVGAASRVGVFFLMVSFGAAFGYTVMARVSLLVGRFQFLLYYWLRVAQ